MLDIALEAAKAHGHALRALNIKVGALSSASAEALDFCMKMLLDERSMGDVEVRIREAPARARCECGYEGEIKNLFEGCPRCGGFQRDILDGQDVTLDTIEVANDKD